MADTVKLFQLTRVYFQTLGICPMKPDQKYAFNLRRFFVLLSMIVIFISTAAFFFVKAESVKELTYTFYVSCTEIGFVICFLINIWKITNILRLIGEYERFHRKSKS